MTQKIILLGSDGQLGKALKKVLSGYFELHTFSKGQLDITDFNVVEQAFTNIQPEFVVNAAAYTNVDKAESEKDLARQINAEAVGNLAELCKKRNAKLIHFSTDYVFDGKNEIGYSENAATQPINFYGQTKLEGEQNIQNSGCDFAIIRTSWLFGDGKNFVNTMLNLAQKKSEINSVGYDLSHGVKVVSDQIGCPTYTEDLAEATKEIIQNCHSREGGNPEKLQEIFHLTNSGSTSWADFARKIFELTKLPTKVIDIPTSEYPTPAKRPQNSVLLNTKLPLLKSWEEALEEFLQARK